MRFWPLRNLHSSLRTFDSPAIAYLPSNLNETGYNRNPIKRIIAYTPSALQILPPSIMSHGLSLIMGSQKGLFVSGHILDRPDDDQTYTRTRMNYTTPSAHASTVNYLGRQTQIRPAFRYITLKSLTSDHVRAPFGCPFLFSVWWRASSSASLGPR